MSLENVKKILPLIDRIDYREGLIAYQRYRNMLSKLAEKYALPLPSVIAAFVSLSPNNNYMGNLRSTVTLLECLRQGKQVEWVNVSTYRACKFRAWKYLTGELDFLAVTKGPKIRSFYFNIIDPENPDYVTIDGHMFSLWIGERMKMVESARARIKYQDVAKGISQIAICEQGLIPNQLQAMLWFTWKRIHNIVYSPQLNLLDPTDHWRNNLNPDQIRPFRGAVS